MSISIYESVFKLPVKKLAEFDQAYRIPTDCRDAFNSVICTGVRRPVLASVSGPITPARKDRVMSCWQLTIGLQPGTGMFNLIYPNLADRIMEITHLSE